MKRPLNTILKENVDLSEKETWSASRRENCFRILVEAIKKDSGGSKVTLKVEPEAEGYEIIVNYRLDVGKMSEFIECDKWRNAEELLCLETNDHLFDVAFAIDVEEILAPQNLAVPTSYRNFHVLTSEIDFYVNTTQLKELGGKLFKEWYDKECLGEDTVVVQSMDARELDILLNASCVYSAPIVHRRNFDLVLRLANEYKINGLLRCLEMYLIKSRSIHKIRKLEYASQYRMARLADIVLRSFNSRIERLDSLFDYLSANDECLEDVHPDILEMFEIAPTHIIL